MQIILPWRAAVRMVGLLSLMSWSRGYSQPFIDACFTSPAVGTSFASTANVTNRDSDLLRWTGSNWTGYWPMANITIPPPGSVVNTRAIWSGDGTVWTTGGEGFGLRLTSPIVTGTTYTFAFQRVSHGFGQNGTHAPVLYTNTGGSFGTSYGAIPGVGTAWTTTNISFTATAGSSGHTFVYFHNSVGSGMFLGCTTTILPMAFSGLQAFPLGKAVHLEWQVQDEANYAWHVVERATDGFTFEEVGRIPSAHAVGIPHPYHHVDEEAGSAGSPLLYYRIRSIDQEGLEAMSPIIATQLGTPQAFHVKLAPNPVIQGLDVVAHYYAEDATVARYTLMDLQGRIHAQGECSTRAGHNETSLPTATLATGVYWLKLQAGSRTAVSRFVVQ